MKLLEERILRDGRILPGNILKVDKFLNHQIDPELFMEMGKDYYEHFKGQGINKILTLEVSGIAVAFAAATYFKCPVVFAKKSQSLTLADDVYSSKVISYTKKKEYDIKVDKNFLTKDDKVLIIDDFLATGQALHGLVGLCDQAGAEVKGIGIAIEKSFQDGGKKFREMGYDVYSQAMIEEFTEDSVKFKR
ncbi:MULTISPECIES: xanthine phosphoribosyltransferase [Peptostreptococcus]|uniref:Xanthine phosphoribosyltransferase n=3 Tax=Peptostreptococcus anaerobius TaxID=1261 RepID=D3MSY1_9FIRM|nr:MULTISPECIES: xanthine phosphoribosyltransferase [Peptostreptococcus]EFD04790.1 xanthine phosphoribosyltransferase [Peptostreptococcus anaerobius 653-L]MBS5596207.1 xanthine phosphoribosyltransferase [Peptostreptococcus sp.]MCB6983007.1 xanthine phosphoribosyltransferase [Peptostreptococcus anaerobius]MCQ5151157.1 xanthine phosphoribosyltransferase [Peptostreptococcus anaerobius]MDB8821478.1 xanthine phosphoribosyltransferase [Peptostreptococcus anaerobius]